MENPPEAAYGGYGPMRSYGRMYGSLDFNDVSICRTKLENVLEFSLKILNLPSGDIL